MSSSSLSSSARQPGVVGLLGLGLLALLPSGAEAGFYLPGVAPKTYQMKENVRVLMHVCGSMGRIPRQAADTPRPFHSN